MTGRRNGESVRFSILSRTPVALCGKLLGAQLVLPYYHLVSDEEIVHVKHLYDYKTVMEFKDDLDFLLRKYRPLSLHDLLSMVKSGNCVVEDSFCLSFDDGYREIVDVVAPILLEKGISATVFVNSAFVDNLELCHFNKASLIVERLQRGASASVMREVARILELRELNGKDIQTSIVSTPYERRCVLDDLANLLDLDFRVYLQKKRPYLTVDDIRGLVKRGFTVGGHSIDHPLYESLPVEEQVYQTVESVRYVRERFELGYGAFAFPHTDRNVTVEFFERLSESGLLDLTFGTGGLIEDSAKNNFQRFSLERPLAPAESIVAFQHARKLFKKVTRRGRVVRV